MSGEGTNRKRRGSLPACGLEKCGSTAGWAMVGEGPCEDCGGGVFHTGEDFLCAACHRTSPRWYHLGPSVRGDAVAWVQECRAVGAGLPTAVVKSFVPSGACLFSWSDCFFLTLKKYREKYREQNQQHVCIPCGTNKSHYWRTGAERAQQYQLYFTGEGVGRTDRGMRKTKEVITAASYICNPCHMAFYAFMKSSTRLPTTKELLAAPTGPKLPKGTARANIAVVRHVYEALAAGTVVCSEDIAGVLARERRDNEVNGVSDRHLRLLVWTLMEDIGKGVADVCVREYGGGTFGDDKRTTFVYLFPTNMNVDVLAANDRKLRRMHRENQELRQQLQEARGKGGSGSGQATVTPQMHDQRVEAAKIGGKVVREDIIAARELRNVRYGSTYEDDIERQLVPAKEYLHQLPESLRALLANVFGLDMGFRDNTTDEEEELPATNSRASAQQESSQKKYENRSYFLTTMYLNALLQDDYRAPHEMMISQTLKSHGTSRVVIDFCAMLGICISERGRYDREEIVVRNRKDHSLVPPGLSVVAVAWDNNDMKPTMNLVGQDYVPFCAASSVGIRGKTLRLCPETEWMGLKDLSVKMVTDGQPRDDDNNVFMGWRQLLHQSAYASSDAGVGARNHTCLEVEIRQVRLRILIA